jgi:metallothionein
MATVTQMKCACKSCLCVISLADAIMKDDKPYCSDACAKGHVGGEGCAQTSCGCNS